MVNIVDEEKYGDTAAEQSAEESVAAAQAANENGDSADLSGEALEDDTEALENAAKAANTETGGKADALEELKAELAAANDKAVRLYADFENFRKRMERERLETWSRAEQEVLGGILPIVDNFDRALSEAGDDPFSTGVKMVHSSLLDFLKKHNVVAIESLGKPFDPAVHEAVAYQPSPEADEGIVIYETRKGYRKGDTVLRPSSVIVSSGKPDANPNA